MLPHKQGSDGGVEIIRNKLSQRLLMNGLRVPIRFSSIVILSHLYEVTSDTA